MLKATQLGFPLPACSGGDDSNERDVFDRLFEAAPEKLGAVKTVNSTHPHTCRMHYNAFYSDSSQLHVYMQW